MDGVKRPSDLNKLMTRLKLRLEELPNNEHLKLAIVLM